MRQFGFSLMFLTAAPFKWTFPWSQWLSELRNQTGRGPAEVAIPETLHMAQSCETKRVADPQRLPYPRHCTWHGAAKPNGSRTRRGCHTRDTAHGTCPPTDHPQIFMRQKYQSLEKPRLRQQLRSLRKQRQKLLLPLRISKGGTLLTFWFVWRICPH